MKIDQEPAWGFALAHFLLRAEMPSQKSANNPIFLQDFPRNFTPTPPSFAAKGGELFAIYPDLS
jgi:hypothetical protein